MKTKQEKAQSSRDYRLKQADKQEQDIKDFEDGQNDSQFLKKSITDLKKTSKRNRVFDTELQTAPEAQSQVNQIEDIDTVPIECHQSYNKIKNASKPSSEVSIPKERKTSLDDEQQISVPEELFSGQRDEKEIEKYFPTEQKDQSIKTFFPQVNASKERHLNHHLISGLMIINGVIEKYEHFVNCFSEYLDA